MIIKFSWLDIVYGILQPPIISPSSGYTFNENGIITIQSVQNASIEYKFSDWQEYIEYSQPIEITETKTIEIRMYEHYYQTYNTTLHYTVIQPSKSISVTPSVSITVSSSHTSSISESPVDNRLTDNYKSYLVSKLKLLFRNV